MIFFYFLFFISCLSTYSPPPSSFLNSIIFLNVFFQPSPWGHMIPFIHSLKSSSIYWLLKLFVCSFLWVSCFVYSCSIGHLSVYLLPLPSFLKINEIWNNAPGSNGYDLQLSTMTYFHRPLPTTGVWQRRPVLFCEWGMVEGTNVMVIYDVSCRFPLCPVYFQIFSFLLFSDL